MATEIYQLNFNTDGSPLIYAQALPEGATYIDPGYGDGVGNDRTITVFYGRAELMNCKTKVTELDGDMKEIAISDIKHDKTLTSGEQYIEELVGPEGERRIQLIRNNGEQPAFPHYTHIFHALADAVEYPDVDWTVGLN